MKDEKPNANSSTSRPAKRPKRRDRIRRYAKSPVISTRDNTQIGSEHKSVSRSSNPGLKSGPRNSATPVNPGEPTQHQTSLNFAPTASRQKQAHITSNEAIDSSYATSNAYEGNEEYSNNDHFSVEDLNLRENEVDPLPDVLDANLELHTGHDDQSLAKLSMNEQDQEKGRKDPVELKQDVADDPQSATSIDRQGSLSLQIPGSVLREVMQTSLSSRAAYWSHELYEGPTGEKVTVHYCTSIQRSEECALLFVDEPVLGFDLEWYPYARRNQGGLKQHASLIQLASETRVALFHLAGHWGDGVDELLAPTLKRILECGDILKVGVNVAQDRTRLEHHLNIKGNGYFELSHLYKLVKYAQTDSKKVNKGLVRLSTIAQDTLQLPLSKGPVRSSNWSAYRLSYEQQRYAAADAYAGFRIFDVLETWRKQMTPTPPRPALHELNKPILFTMDEIEKDNQ